MGPKMRRAELLKLLQMDMKPMSAGNLAEHFEVSRQVIVGDISLLRAAGHDIVATQKGYLMENSGEDMEVDTYILSCKHDKGQLEAELYTIVDNGGVVVNVSVEHKLYGTITQDLNIRSRFDVDEFLNKVAINDVKLLSSLTDDEHMHTIRCSNPQAYRRILARLQELRILNIRDIN